MSERAACALELIDSRRLTGPNLLWHRPSAVIDIRFRQGETPDPEILGQATVAWQDQARRILDLVGWDGEETTSHCYPDGASLAMSAPIDALYAATEVNEWAWEATAQGLSAGAAPRDHSAHAAAAQLREQIQEEQNPQLVALQAEARGKRQRFLSDDDFVSIGGGKGSLTWPVKEIPSSHDVPWHEISDVPTALITGTNGKTTTVRLLAAMVREAGLQPGFSSTDGIFVGRDLVEDGDYSGPGGARSVLRNRAVDIALLETARGGMLRRGLGVADAQVAVITNVAEDHLGEFGIADLAALTDVKFIVARAAKRLVLNADDREITSKATLLEQKSLSWFSLDPNNAVLLDHRDRDGTTISVEEENFVRRTFVRHVGNRETCFGSITNAPLTIGGTAAHNIANALAAIAAATELQLPDQAIAAALRSFGQDLADNPGRLNVFELGDTKQEPARVIVDFAHNPHGLAALLEMARAAGGRRLLVVVGQAGDRDDESIRELARTVWAHRPDRILLKQLSDYLRGREAGEVEDLIAEELLLLGASEENLDRALSEGETLSKALRWSRPGDVLLLVTHAHREQSLAALTRLQRDGWAPGTPLPDWLA